MKILSRFNQFIETRQKRAAVKERDAYTQHYIKKHSLSELIARAKDASGSTGADPSDYVLLHSVIRRRKPVHVLECGTGISTWIIADALKRNYERNNVKGVVISMEHEEKWYKEAAGNLPEEFKPYVQIHYRPMIYWSYSILYGCCYEEVPKLPYDIVFIDGPYDLKHEPDGTHLIANMDFIRLVSKTDKPTLGIIDSRRATAIASGIAFGRDKVQYSNVWKVGIIGPVSRKDLEIQSDDWTTFKNVMKKNMVYYYGMPEILKETRTKTRTK